MSNLRYGNRSHRAVEAESNYASGGCLTIQCYGPQNQIDGCRLPDSRTIVEFSASAKFRRGSNTTRVSISPSAFPIDPTVEHVLAAFRDGVETGVPGVGEDEP